MDDTYMLSSQKLQRVPKPVWLSVAIIFLFLSILGIILTCIFWYFANQLIYSYGVIIDAGSTSSKIYLYKWPEYPSRTNGKVTEVDECKISPGISSYTAKPNNSIVRIRECIQKKILPKIPVRLQEKSYIYLGATAGMRLVEKQNPIGMKNIFNSISQYLDSSILRVNNTLDDVKTISGTVEGIGAWITVNYLKGTLQRTRISDIISPKAQKTYGALDLGGASTQITFVPDTVTKKLHEMPIRLYGSNYSVYSYSYLCYGKSQAQFRYLALLVQDYKNYYESKSEPSIPHIPNPCLLKGDRVNKTLHQILNVPCVDGDYALKMFGYSIKYPDHLKNRTITVTFKGTGKPDECQALIDRLFNTDKCSHDTCAFNNVYRPALTDRFLAFAGFNVVHKVIQQFTKNPLTYDEFNKTARKYCSDKAPTVVVQARNLANDSEKELFRRWRCFDFLYVLTLLKNFGFNQTNWNSITFVAKVNDATVGWSLGYMINKTALIPVEKPLFSMSPTALILLLLWCLIILSFGLLFFIITYKVHRSNKSRKRTDEIDLQSKDSENKLSEHGVLYKA